MRTIQRSMASAAAAVVVWSSLPICPVQAEEASAKAELRYQVREIFQSHCLNCHGDAAKGEIKILDHALLVGERQVVRPGSPETSELFDLVAGGSMPPGNRLKVSADDQAILRKWIQAGALPLPSDRDEDYVLWNIVRDFRDQKDPQKKPFLRYLSLNHLVGQNGARLDREREALRDLLRYLTAEGKQPPELNPIESTKSVFRIDLQELGWDQPPYPKAQLKSPYPKEQLNLFDLILLEYPYGRLQTRSPFYSELYRFLDTTKQIRPISYVRADWLVRELSRPPLHPDFRHVLDKLPDSKPPQSVLSLPNLSAPADAAGTIVPLDGLTYQPKPNADVVFRAIDFKQRMNPDPPAKEIFAPGDQMTIWIKPTRASVVELNTIDKNGKMTLTKKIYEIKAGEALKDSNPVVMELAANEQQDSEEYAIFVYPRDDLKATNAMFPNGTVLEAKGILHDRVIHPLYRLRPDGKGFEPPDAGKMVKVTIHVKTQRK